MSRIKNCLMLLFLTALLFLPGISEAAEIDPILLDEPNEKVFECGNDIFIEFTALPTISKTANGRTTSEFFVILRAEILFLADKTWYGIDKDSFSLKFTDADGCESFFPLNYAISMMANQKSSWDPFWVPYDFADLRFTNLIFTVPANAAEGWTLMFSPKERGADSPYCEIEIPLKFK
ncbi:MAG: hypothetical protein IKP86_08865 [Anaerolineaceae bacterium]|nr:hypothetical protein [Anaerolineaceae bacterium]